MNSNGNDAAKSDRSIHISVGCSGGGGGIGLGGSFTETGRKSSKAEAAAFAAKREAAIAEEHAQHCRHLSLVLNIAEGPLIAALDPLSRAINQHMNRQGFWQSENSGEKMALMHSEISEALEADRKSLDAEHIPGFTGVEEELADTVIRILDFCQQNDLRIGQAIIAKMQYNLSRPFMHGKKY